MIDSERDSVKLVVSLFLESSPSVVSDCLCDSVGMKTLEVSKRYMKSI